MTRNGGHRVALVPQPAITAALDAYLTTRAATPPVATTATTADRVAGQPAVTSANVTGPLLATNTGGRLDQAALWHLVR